jgi:Mlc titration factor MtfA (ptsG expression regulator)
MSKPTYFGRVMKNGQSNETGNIWYTRHKTKTNKQSKNHNIICVEHHHTQDTRRGQTNQKTQYANKHNVRTLSKQQ